MNLTGMERRVSVLERPQNMGGIDPLILVMETLTDTELGLLDEYFSLLKAGFAQAEISEMMGIESYQQTLAIADKIEEELRVRQPMRPERRGKPLKMPKEHRYDESGLGVPGDAEA